MRWMTLLLASTTAGFALTPQDLMGTWRTEGWEGPGSVMEAWYGEDGSRELRSAATYEGIGDYKLHVLGTWQVSGESVVEKTTGGWTSFDGEIEPIQPDATQTGSKVELIASAPRKFKITDCDTPSQCTTREFSFVSATKQFTLSDLGSSTSTQRRGIPRGFRLRGSGRAGARLFAQGRVFDLRGRLLAAPFPIGR